LQIQPSKFAKCPTVDHEIAERNPTVHGSLKAHATIASQCRKKKNRNSPLQKLSAIRLPHSVQNPKPFLSLETKQSSSKITLSSSLCVSRFYSKKTGNPILQKKNSHSVSFHSASRKEKEGKPLFFS
jgi:hypothetical protein